MEKLWFCSQAGFFKQLFISGSAQLWFLIRLRDKANRPRAPKRFSNGKNSQNPQTKTSGRSDPSHVKCFWETATPDRSHFLLLTEHKMYHSVSRSVLQRYCRDVSDRIQPRPAAALGTGGRNLRRVTELLSELKDISDSGLNRCGSFIQSFRRLVPAGHRHQEPAEISSHWPALLKGVKQCRIKEFPSWNQSRVFSTAWWLWCRLTLEAHANTTTVLLKCEWGFLRLVYKVEEF